MDFRIILLPVCLFLLSFSSCKKKIDKAEKIEMAVSIDMPRISLTTGEQSILQAAFEEGLTPKRSYEWISSDEAIITVDNNDIFKATVTAKGVGVADIILQSTDGKVSARCQVTVTESNLIVYPAPTELSETMHNDTYDIKVRIPNGEWKDLFEYNAEVDLDNPQQATMSYFDFKGEVEISITPKLPIGKVRVRPLSLQIKPKIAGNTAYFKLVKASKLSVEFDENIFNNVHLFANSIEDNIPQKNDPNVIYFGPGFHQPYPDVKKEYQIPSGKTVYIAGGAVVKATFACKDAQNVTLKGHGIIAQSRYGLKIENSNNVNLNGVILLNPLSYGVFGGSSNNINISDIKSISSARYSDGIDVMSCNNVSISDIFMRNSDDCIAVYGHRWDFYGGASNYKVENATLWADVAHPIFLGIHGNPDDIDTLSNIRFSAVDILEHDEDSQEFQGSMAINAGDNVFVKNITFENINVEDFEEGQLFNLRIVKNKSFNTVSGKGIDQILFKNINYNGKNAHSSVINGFDENRLVKNVIFDNVRINGEKVGAGSSYFKVGQFTQNIEFK